LCAAAGNGGSAQHLQQLCQLLPLEGVTDIQLYVSVSLHQAGMQHE
jgi:hypothetical protein